MKLLFALFLSIAILKAAPTSSPPMKPSTASGILQKSNNPPPLRSKGGFKALPLKANS
ncbi:hypothetical protein N9Z85_03550 [Akkermansiaceae bacterium]|nr:hypothetical protein [Akkermansiaceae bacterium]